MESTAAALERAASGPRRRRARRGARVGQRGDRRRGAAAHHRRDCASASPGTEGRTGADQSRAGPAAARSRHRRAHDAARGRSSWWRGASAASKLGLHARNDYLARHGTPRRCERAGRPFADRLRPAERLRRARQAAPCRASRARRFSLRTDSDLAQLALIRARRGHRLLPGRSGRARRLADACVTAPRSRCSSKPGSRCTKTCAQPALPRHVRRPRRGARTVHQVATHADLRSATSVRRQCYCCRRAPPNSVRHSLTHRCRHEQRLAAVGCDSSLVPSRAHFFDSFFDSLNRGNIMAKILVLYYSMYGHIETMASAVAEGARRSRART